MKRIKTIYCLGTSYTAGGGFEFDALDKSSHLKNIYSRTNIPLEKNNFSYPGQLQYLLGNTIEVINLGKNGYGNERIYRLIFDITTQSNFDKESTLFLIEFSDLGRKEFYSNILNDYIIMNYNHTNKNLKINDIGIANSYYEDDGNTQFILESMRETLFKFHKITYNENEKIKEIQRNNIFLISYLELHGIKYLITNPPTFDEPVLYDKFYPNEINQKYEANRLVKIGPNKLIGMIDYFVNELTLTHETKGLVDDSHSGLVGNYNIAVSIYNKLIEDGLISNGVLKFKSKIEDFFEK